MKAAVVLFPGTNRERDIAIALRRVTGERPRTVWHHETSLDGLDLVVLPGGFSHGDYLRCGAMAARSPVMSAVRDFAARGGHVLGICNGFQILTEAGLLPGALLRNASLRFLSQDCHLRVERTDTPYTSHYQRGAGVPGADGPWRRQLLRRRRHARPARGRGAGRVPLRGKTPTGRRARDRRHLLAEPARARADAASGGPGRSADGRDRWAAAVRGHEVRDSGAIAA